jgi:hypothetical protein
MSITCTIRSTDPELNGQPVDILEYGADGKCLVSLRDCPRLAFWYHGSKLALEEVNHCYCGQPAKYYSDLFGKWLCDTCLNQIANQIYPS